MNTKVARKRKQWKRLANDSVVCKVTAQKWDDTKFRQSVVSSISHGCFGLTAKNGDCCWASCKYCPGHLNCNYQLRLKFIVRESNVIVEYIGDCPSAKKLVSEGKLHRNIKNEIQYAIGSTGTRGDLVNYLKYSDGYKHENIPKSIILQSYRTVMNHMKRECLNIFDECDRRQWFRDYHIRTKEDFDKTVSDLITIDYAGENCTAISFTSPILIRKNLSAMLEHDDFCLCVDGTFKTLQHAKRDEKDWCLITLGTASLEWDSHNRTWRHQFRPLIFTISKTENSEAARLSNKSLIKMAVFLGHDEADIIKRVRCQVSDAASAFQTTAREMFPNCIVMSCWPHIARKPYESWSGKKSSEANMIYFILTILRRCRTVQEFDNTKKICQSYISKFVKGGDNMNKLMKKVYDTLNFRFNINVPGFCLDSQPTESWHRIVNKETSQALPRLYLHPHNGSLIKILRTAVENYTSDEIHYTSDDSVYEPYMVCSCTKILMNHVNIRKNESEDENVEGYIKQRAKRAMGYIFKGVEPPRNGHLGHLIEIARNDHSFITRFNHTKIGQRLTVDNKQYFADIKSKKNFYYIGIVVCVIPKKSLAEKELFAISGFAGNVGNDGRSTHDLACFKIESDIEGNDFDPVGLYCMRLIELDKFHNIHSISSKRILRKIKSHIKPEMIEGLGSEQLRELIKWERKTLTRKGKNIQHVKDTNGCQQYFVNNNTFLNREISDARIAMTNLALNGYLQVTDEELEDFGGKILDSMSYHVVNVDKAETSISCDCADYAKKRVCSHTLAVRISLGLLTIGNLGHQKPLTKFQELKSYFGKTVVRSIDTTHEKNIILRGRITGSPDSELTPQTKFWVQFSDGRKNHFTKEEVDNMLNYTKEDIDKMQN